MKAGRRSTPINSPALFVLAMLTIAGCNRRVVAADMVLRNGKVVTMDSTRPAGQAIAISTDTIVAVGSDSAIQRYVGSGTKVIDLQGHLAIPGFIESHGHFTGLGEALNRVGLSRQRALPCRYLSAGQKKRLGLARLIVTARPLWLLDEPFAALDTNGRVLAAELMQAHCACGGIVVAASHDALGFAARSLRLGAA